MTTPETKARARARATEKKRQTWNRLVSDPAAGPAMRAIIAYEDERFHAACHVNDWPYVQCGGLCPMRHDREHAHLVEQVCVALLGEADALFCRRFGVTMGYFQRYRTYARRGEADGDRVALPR